MQLATRRDVTCDGQGLTALLEGGIPVLRLEPSREDDELEDPIGVAPAADSARQLERLASFRAGALRVPGERRAGLVVACPQLGAHEAAGLRDPDRRVEQRGRLLVAVEEA